MKRFIAGAKCPECNAEDSLRVWTQQKIQFMDCVHCNYKKSMDNNTDKNSTNLIGIKTVID